MNVANVSSLGEALTTCLTEWSDHTCLIESDRERERARLTYREFSERSLPLAAFLEESGFGPDDRAAVLMTNQSKWHLAAHATFHRGGVLVPLDGKLTPDEQGELLVHARVKVLFVEFHLLRALATTEAFARAPIETVVVVDASGDVPERPGTRFVRWEDATADPSRLALEPRRREDTACIVYSSGTGGRAKGCILTHDNYLEQLHALLALHPFRPGVRYLSILPTNHAIDFMVGFVGPFVCGATVVHLRTLRPELVRDALVRYRITHMALVPVILRNLETGLRERFAALSAPRRATLSIARTLHRWLGRGRPSPALARRLLRPVHAAFGGSLEVLFVGGAPSDPNTLRFFHDLGIPVANGYGLTEAGTAITLDRLDPPRPDTVGTALPGVELRVAGPDADGVGEILVRGRTIMRGYLDDPDLTRETIVDGWLHTGDLGKLEDDGHLTILGRRKNMIVTPGGKNVYPEDVESAFGDLPGVKEHCVFAAHYVWRDRAGRDERLLLVLRPEPSQYPTILADYEGFKQSIELRNRRLVDFRRVGAFVL
jgi:long-chain acyl-CoA synthetase